MKTQMIQPITDISVKCDTEICLFNAGECLAVIGNEHLFLKVP